MPTYGAIVRCGVVLRLRLRCADTMTGWGAGAVVATVVLGVGAVSDSGASVRQARGLWRILGLVLAWVLAAVGAGFILL